VKLAPHRIFRVSGRDLYMDLPLAPWEAVLGATVDIPTPGGVVRLKVKPNTQAGQQLRLAKRGLPKPGHEGDLYAIVQIVIAPEPGEREQTLYKSLAEASKFDPRAHLEQEMRNESRAH
jgi:curved DNA-binding protein